MFAIECKRNEKHIVINYSKVNENTSAKRFKQLKTVVMILLECFKRKYLNKIIGNHFVEIIL